MSVRDLFLSKKKKKGGKMDCLLKETTQEILEWQLKSKVWKHLRGGICQHFPPADMLMKTCHNIKCFADLSADISECL